MRIIFILMGTFASLAWSQQSIGPDSNAPAEVVNCMKALGSGYAINRALDPFYLRGNFYGDGKAGFAVLVEREHQRGVMFCRSGGATPAVLGAGTKFNGMVNLDFTAWQPHPKDRRVGKGAGEREIPTPAGDAILLEWADSASALVYWNGRRFVWYQQGD